MYVFNSPVFSQRTLLCRSIDSGVATDQCSVNRNGEYYIAVAGFFNSDYALSVSTDGQQAATVEVATLQLDVPVTGSLRANTERVYRASSGNNATLTSITGNAQLRVFASDQFNSDTLVCLSEQSGSALDSCQYNNSAVYIGVVADTDTNYSLVISTSQPAGPIATQPVVAECIDSDGDGFGWDGTATCLVSASSGSSDSASGSSGDPLPCIDEDGDGFGWDGSATCLVSASTGSTASAGLVDESSFGSLACVDADGDGWGWQQPAGRPDLSRSCRIQ